MCLTSGGLADADNGAILLKGERKRTQSKTVYRKKSVEAIVPEKGRAEQFAVVKYTRKQGNLNQNVLMRRVSAYPRGLLKIGD